MKHDLIFDLSMSGHVTFLYVKSVAQTCNYFTEFREVECVHTAYVSPHRFCEEKHHVTTQIDQSNRVSKFLSDLGYACLTYQICLLLMFQVNV